MATSSAVHGSLTARAKEAKPTTPAKPNETLAFLGDLWMTIRHEFTHAEGTREVDLFRKHMNAMAITYFAIVILCMLASLPVLAYLVNYNWQM